MIAVDGFYSMSFTGLAGSGYGLMVLFAGTLAGSDATGATYDGEYSIEGQDKIRFKMTLKAPAGVWLVQTGQPLERPLEMPLEALLKDNFASGVAMLVETPAGPVNVAFRKLRDLPVGWRQSSAL